MHPKCVATSRQLLGHLSRQLTGSTPMLPSVRSGTLSKIFKAEITSCTRFINFFSFCLSYHSFVFRTWRNTLVSTATPLSNQLSTKPGSRTRVMMALFTPNSLKAVCYQRWLRHLQSWWYVHVSPYSCGSLSSLFCRWKTVLMSGKQVNMLMSLSVTVINRNGQL